MLRQNPQHQNYNPSTKTTAMADTPFFFTLTRYDQMRALESLIFASDDPLTLRALHRVLVHEDPLYANPDQQALPFDGDAPAAPEPKEPFQVPEGTFESLIDDINDDLERTDRPYRIVKIAGGFQFATTPQHGVLVQRLLKSKHRRRLTQAALESLAIISYRQPITKAEIDAIRGVNSGEVVNSLIEKQLVTIVGRSETPGKPLLYGTTEDFLRTFGLNSLSDLPRLREIDDMIKTATSIVETDESITVTADHRMLRRQLAELIDLGDGPKDQTADPSASSGAYFEPQGTEESEQPNEEQEDTDVEGDGN